MPESDNILTKLHDPLLYVIPVLAKFPRDHKFTLGDRVLLRLLDVQECYVMAYYGRDKAGPLTEANLHLEMARHQEAGGRSGEVYGLPRRPGRKPTRVDRFRRMWRNEYDTPVRGQ
jgi:hypothetical protein